MNRADYLIGCAVLGGFLLGDAGPREDAQAASGDPPPLLHPSEIPGVPDAAWTRFADEARMERRADGALVRRSPGAVSASNGLGMFEMRPRRLADLGLVGAPTPARDPATGRMVWVTDFVPPYSTRRFLADLELQYEKFAESMRAYASAIRDGSIEAHSDEEMTLSGQLALLHKLGPSGLRTWARGEHFERTADFYQRANGIF